jgi:hypothetical protein
MNPTDEALLKELEQQLESKFQKLMLAGYVKNPSTEGVLRVALAAIERAASKHESQ